VLIRPPLQFASQEKKQKTFCHHSLSVPRVIAPFRAHFFPNANYSSIHYYKKHLYFLLKRISLPIYWGFLIWVIAKNTDHFLYHESQYLLYYDLLEKLFKNKIKIISIILKIACNQNLRSKKNLGKKLFTKEDY